MTSTPDLELFEKETSLDILSLFTLIQRRKFKIFISIFSLFLFILFWNLFPESNYGPWYFIYFGDHNE